MRQLHRHIESPTIKEASRIKRTLGLRGRLHVGVLGILGAERLLLVISKLGKVAAVYGEGEGEVR